uniref:Uncharacterized protein n=1 Tax=Ditylenchus dipsaci TaxID=166011 RepID=A0A915E505_9BILA
MTRKKKKREKRQQPEDPLKHREVAYLSAWKGWSSMVSFTCRAVPRKVRLYIFPEQSSEKDDGVNKFEPFQWQRLIPLRSSEAE